MNKSNDGQSTIEFLLTFIFSIGLLFLFVQMAFTAGRGYLVHYATFMASRAYLVYDNQSIQQDDTGVENVLNEILDDYGLRDFRIGPDKRTLTINRSTIGNKIYDYSGVALTFKSKTSLLPVIGGGQDITLTSESFLGKEPTRRECLERLCNHVVSEHINSVCNTQRSDHYYLTLFDNGC